jgi:S1-C subfamily serine protease
MKLNDEERRKLGLPPDGLAVRVTAIFGDHARRAGLKNGDVLIRFDGIQRDLTIQQLHAHLHLNKNYGDSIALVLRRDGQELTLEMTLPSQPPNLE